MTDISDRYRRNAADFAATIAAVPSDRWHDPSPCEGWDALAVVGHVVGTHDIFEGMVGRKLPPGPSVDDDPLAAFRAVSDHVLAELEDPERADVAFDGFFGPTTFARAIDRFQSLDLVIHRWDLARATGGDEVIPAEEVARAWTEVEAFGDAMRGPQAFGPPVEPPPGADDQARLLCLLGRRV